MAQPALAKLEFVEELLSLSRHAIAAAVQPEVDADKAEALAQRITESFLSVWGGCSLYLPKAEYLERLRRDRAIARDFTGGEECAARLARKYGVSSIYVYRICREQRNAG
ncbi:MAG: hypothetical protein KAX46_09600 [Chromatiaceae bacterium]|nr:hypothetical protein [Chromatiaceae bacterium]